MEITEVSVHAFFSFSSASRLSGLVADQEFLISNSQLLSDHTEDSFFARSLLTTSFFAQALAPLSLGIDILAGLMSAERPFPSV